MKHSIYEYKNKTLKQPYIYKYRDPNNFNIKSLELGEIFFASPSEMNDVNENEMFYVFRGSCESWNKHIDQVLLELKKKYPSNNMIESLCKNKSKLVNELKIIQKKKEYVDLKQFKETLIKFYRKYELSEEILKDEIKKEEKRIKKTKHNTYIASFSTKPLNPSMFSHYASNHEGFVLVFKTRISKQTGKIQLRFYKKLKYKEGRYPIKSIDYRVENPIKNVFYEKKEEFQILDSEEYHEEWIGRVKNPEWQYESEFRCFLNHQELPINTKNGSISGFESTYLREEIKEIPELRVMLYHPNDIAGIIFGSKMDKNTQARIITASYNMRCSSKSIRSEKESLEPLYFMQASQKDKTNELDLLPKGILNIEGSSHCKCSKSCGGICSSQI